MSNKKRIIKDIFLIIAGIAMIIAFVIIGNNTEKKPEETDASKFVKEYTKVRENNPFIYKTGEEIIEILNSGTGIVYLGFPECQWCQSYIKMVDDVASDLEVKNIYYFNIKDDRASNTKVYQDIVKILDSNLEKDDEGNKRIYVPELVFVKKGKIIAHDNETSTISGNITPSEYWTDDKVISLKNKLRENMALVVTESCETCN